MSNSLFNTVSKDASAAQKRIERLARLMTGLMEEMHGDHWRFCINQELGSAFVLISPDPDRDDLPVQPKPEVA